MLLGCLACSAHATSLASPTKVQPVLDLTEDGGPEHAASIARHTRSGVAGISRCRTPSAESASTIALTTTASAGVVPPSPPERTPRRLEGEGTSLNAVVRCGNMSARGIA